MKKRSHPLPSAQNLNQAALRYLSRYASSEAALRRTLLNRLKRAAMRNPVFAADKDTQHTFRSEIETIIEKYKQNGVLNDASYAAAKTGSLRRQGRSRRYIQQALAIKGINADISKASLLTIDNDGDAELNAARLFAKKKRLGVFRSKPADDQKLRKDLAAMARAGYSLSIARQALNAKIDLRDE